MLLKKKGVYSLPVDMYVLDSPLTSCFGDKSSGSSPLQSSKIALAISYH